MTRRLERRCRKTAAAMQQQQHSQVAAVAAATSSHSHHWRDRSLLLPAKPDPPEPELGSKAEEGASAGAEGELPLPGRPSIETDAFPPDLPWRPEEEGAKAGRVSSVGSALGLLIGLTSVGALSMEAKPLSIWPRAPEEEDWSRAAATGPGAAAAAD